MPSPRRFPPPWSIEDIGAAFVVKDGNDQKLAYVCITRKSPDGVRRRSCSAKMRQGGLRPTSQATRAVGQNENSLEVLILPASVFMQQRNGLF